MESAQLSALILGVLTALPAIVLSVATLIQVIKTSEQVKDLGRGLNGRLDTLLAEREARVRAEAAVETERARAASLSVLAVPTRPEPVIERRDPTERP